MRGRDLAMLLGMDEVARLLELQSGVIARRQLLAHGVTPAGIERALRRRELSRLLPGVFVDHTGEPTWVQRAWAGVLHWWPAALTDASALRATTGPGWRRHDDAGPVWVAVDVRRTVVPAPGFSTVRLTGFEELVQWNTSPPRILPELAGIRVAAACSNEMTTLGVLADLCQSRRTTAGRLLATLDTLPGSAADDGWSTSSPTSSPEPAPCSNADTSLASSVPTICLAARARTERSLPRDSCSGTSPTRDSGCMSSSTDGSSTTLPPSATAISIAISKPRQTAAGRSGSGGGRSSAGHA